MPSRTHRDLAAKLVVCSLVSASESFYLLSRYPLFALICGVLKLPLLQHAQLHYAAAQNDSVAGSARCMISMSKSLEPGY